MGAGAFVTALEVLDIVVRILSVKGDISSFCGIKPLTTGILDEVLCMKPEVDTSCSLSPGFM